MTNSDLLLAGLTLLVMLAGIVGIIVPVLPDVWLIWLAALGYGLLAGFDGWIGGLAMVAITALTVIGVAIDIALGPVAAKRGGASWQAIGASMALGLVGLFVFPPFGALIGAIVGLFVVEYSQRQGNTQEAINAVKGYVLGCGSSAIIRVFIGLAMIGIWVVWVWLANRG